ncbi:MAG: hypothetical protein AAGC60_19640 [Acidobacteriota bacterium]
MTRVPRDRVETAFARLFDADDPLFLPTAARRGTRVRRDVIHPLRAVALDDTTPLLLFHRDPWGGVSIELRDQKLGGFDTLRARSLHFDEQARSVHLELEARAPEYHGRYIVRTGGASGSAIESAMVGVGLGGAAADGDDPNITLAKQQQQDLIQTDNGLIMVGAYWDNNRTLNEIVNMSPFQTLFSGDTFTTMASDTATAVGKKPDSQVINPGGSSGQYNSNAATARALVAGQAQKGAEHYCQKGDTTTAQRYWNAFVAATSFNKQIQPVADNEQTTKGVKTAVSNTPTPNLPDPGDACSQLAMPRSELRPELREAIEESEAVAKREGFVFVDDPVGAARERSAQTGGGVPIDGTFRADVGATRLSLRGRLVHDLQRRRTAVVIDRVDAVPGTVDLALATFPEPLYDAVRTSLDDARFLHDVLAQRLAAAFDAPVVREFVGRHATLALAAQA